MLSFSKVICANLVCWTIAGLILGLPSDADTSLMPGELPLNFAVYYRPIPQPLSCNAGLVCSEPLSKCRTVNFQKYYNLSDIHSDDVSELLSAFNTRLYRENNPYWYMEEPVTYPCGSHLTRTGGVYKGPSGRETYYNLDMRGVVARMRALGYSEEDYPYWIRSDGVKMLGPYVMVAANLRLRPRGSILPCSMGEAIVVDTGSFIKRYPKGLDIAVNW